jgi:chorismate synthase
MLRLLTAGESHGMALVGVLRPAVRVPARRRSHNELAGRRHTRPGGEASSTPVEIVGRAHGRTLGSPIAVTIGVGGTKYRDLMAVEEAPGRTPHAVNADRPER